MPDVLVVIDNKPAGRTDASGTLIWTVEALAHTVRVEKVGFDAPAEKRLTLADKQSLQVAFTLTPQSARLELRGAPAGVEIRMNGTLLGRTGSGAFSAVVPPGAQTLRITEATESREIAQAFEAGRTVILDWSGVAPAVAVTPTPPKIDPAEQAWEALATSTDPAQVQAFIDKYPSGAHAADARSMLEKLVWSRTNQNDAQGLRDYLSRFPAGPHVRESAARLGDLAWNGVDKKDSGSLRAFVDQNPDSAHLGDARSLIDQLQRQAEAERLAQDKAKEQANAQAKAAAAKAAADKAAALRQQQNQAIQSALDQFNAAFEHKSQRELRQIWLRPAQDYLDAINQSGPNSFIATLRPTADAVVANDTATVICELTTLTTFRGQVRPPNRAIMKVTLRNAGGGWQILDLSKP